MDFFERYLHISPDRGSGATEAFYVLAVTIFILLLFNRTMLRNAARTCNKVPSYALRGARQRFGTKHL